MWGHTIRAPLARFACPNVGITPSGHPWPGSPAPILAVDRQSDHAGSPLHIATVTQPREVPPIGLHLCGGGLYNSYLSRRSHVLRVSILGLWRAGFLSRHAPGKGAAEGALA